MFENSNSKPFPSCQIMKNKYHPNLRKTQSSWAQVHGIEQRQETEMLSTVNAEVDDLAGLAAPEFSRGLNR